MILGRITGRITTTEFTFNVVGDPRKFDYVQVYHKDYGYVLGQVIEIERRDTVTTASCVAIGYLDDEGKVRQVRTPFEPDTEVLKAEDSFIQSMIQLDDEIKGGFLGFLEGKKIPVNLDLNKLLTKHVAVLAKSGAGKSYCVGVLLEEILERRIPLLVIDPHGEYSQLRLPNTGEPKLEEFGLEPKGYMEHVQEYGDASLNEGVKPLRLPEDMSCAEIIQLLPAKLSPTQQNVLYSALQGYEKINFHELIHALEMQENNAKFSVISIAESLFKLPIFSSDPIPYNEMVQSGRCTIINLRGIEPDIQQVIVAKLLSDLFELRKQEKVPPFFSVIEEAHNYCPERSFGEAKSSRIIRTIASEGRKFGQGLCIVSQRPARVDKSVISQCSTQLILKVTNPNDIKALTASVEGITSESEKEIINLPIGAALVTGVVDVPLFVSVRPRRSKHGGEAINMITEEEAAFFDKVDEFDQKEILPIIRPNFSIKERQIMEGREIRSIKTTLVPAALFVCQKSSNFRLLANLASGGIVHNEETLFIPDIHGLDTLDLHNLKDIFKRKQLPLTSGVRLKNLEKLGYVVRESDHYRLNPLFVFTSLEKKQTFKKIEYTSVAFDGKLDAKVDVDEMKRQISRYVKVEDAHDCWLIQHAIEYEEAPEKVSDLEDQGLSENQSTVSE